MTNIVMELATMEMSKFLFLNSDNAMSGSCARRSASTNSALATAVATSSPMMVGEVHACSLPPHKVASVSAVTAATSVTAPPTSNGALSAARRGFGRKTAAMTMAASASGTSNQNAQRQPTASAKNPPSSGPANMGTA